MIWLLTSNNINDGNRHLLLYFIVFIMTLMGYGLLTINFMLIISILCMSKELL